MSRKRLLNIKEVEDLVIETFSEHTGIIENDHQLFEELVAALLNADMIAGVEEERRIESDLDWEITCLLEDFPPRCVLVSTN